MRHPTTKEGGKKKAVSGLCHHHCHALLLIKRFFYKEDERRSWMYVGGATESFHMIENFWQTLVTKVASAVAKKPNIKKCKKEKMSTDHLK